MKKIIASMLVSTLMVINVGPAVLAEDYVPLVKTEEPGGGHDDNKFYFDPILYTVNTGKDNGFSGSSAININDPHNGWQLGRFYIEGYTDIIFNDDEIIILKNVGDQITFGYSLEQDIDCLNGDDTLSINDDTGNTDTALQVPTQDFHRGALFINKVDYQGYSSFPVECTDFLESCSVGADTDIDVYEEGDYYIALDYEIKNGREVFGATTVFGHSILPTYTDYRYSFSFKIRNSNCMAYPMDIDTGAELFDGNITRNGFTLDLARSRYLSVNVKYSALVNGRPAVRSNRTASDGEQYVSEGIYEINISNPSTNRSTDITLFVGESQDINLYANAMQYAVVQDEEPVSDDSDSEQVTVDEQNSVVDDTTEWLDTLEMSSPSLKMYMEDTIYSDLIYNLDLDYYVENVEVAYISQEYIEELQYNSMENVFFGYTLTELDEQFEGERYVFSLNENNEIEPQLLQAYGNVDIYDQMLENVVVGAGVIVVCVTVGSVTAVAAPAVSVVFFAAAESGAAMAISTAAISGITQTVISGYETGNMDLAIDAGLLGASDGFKWGAIIGAISGGIGRLAVLREAAAQSSLTINQFAEIQRDTGWSTEFIVNIHSYEEYLVYRNSSLTMRNVGGTRVLVPQIDWTLVDNNGWTNAERVFHNLNPIGADGYPLQVHHIGQRIDSPFAILERSVHQSNSGILHWNNANSTATHDTAFRNECHRIFVELLRTQNPEMYALFNW